MPEPGSEADEAVRDARDALLEAYDDSMTSPTFEADREHDERFITALDAYEAAIRASERAKISERWWALASRYDDPDEAMRLHDEELIALERAKVEALVRAAEAFLARTTLIGRCLNCWESGWAHRDGCEAGALESALDAVRAGRA